MAVSEPALSFQYDSSQSLYEQLTKAQQANSSSFNAQPAVSFSQGQGASPVMRTMDTMAPPQMIGQSVPPLAEGIEAMNPYGQPMTVTPAMGQTMVKRDSEYARPQYNQNGVPLGQAHQRHASMPAYGLEFSPAPSFVSSHYEDYGQRVASFEPLTPPQQPMGLAVEPAYIANEDTGLYTAIPDHLNGGLGGMMQLPASNMSGPSFSRSYGGNNVYSVIEGSPTYKQRRRRSSIPPQLATSPAAIGTAIPTATHRPSDLRRSMSISANGLPEGEDSESPPGLTYSTSAVSMTSQQHKDTSEMSRHGTPLSTVEGSPALMPMTLQHQDFQAMGGDELSSMHEPTHAGMAGAASVVRRARSATVMEMGPYPQKSHACPIPTCGRLFKRLEHLKR